ncbi:MAG TPA: glycosyltransferase family 4 protein [Blastocatellia bacterium]|nr:glycosyltransferase family 4 protein [Blastocatellia bacterium]
MSITTTLPKVVAVETRTLDPTQNLRGTRILVIMPSVPVQGMERSNLQIMKMMRRRGAEVLFVVERLSPHVPPAVQAIGCSTAPTAFYRGFERRLHLSRDVFEMAGVLWAWARTASEVDSIYRRYRPTHIHVTNLDYFLYALPTLWRARCPVIFRLPAPPDTALIGYKKRLVESLWRRWVLPRCDAIICNCRYTLQQVERIGVPGSKARVIYNCLSVRLNTGASDAPRVDSSRFNIAFVGRVRPEKGVAELFEAARRLVREREQVDFYLAGEYEWMNPFAEDLVRRIRSEGLEHRIRIIGPIEDVLGLLEQCDLFVFPSLKESFPNAILEAKSQGLPSVVFPTGGIPEAVTRGLDGYICHEPSAEALYEGIRFYLDRPQELRQAGAAARASLDRFSERTIGDQWADLYLGLL